MNTGQFLRNQNVLVFISMHLLPKLDNLSASFSVYFFGVFSVSQSIFLLSFQQIQITALASNLYMVSCMYDHSPKQSFSLPQKPCYNVVIVTWSFYGNWIMKVVNQSSFRNTSENIWQEDYSKAKVLFVCTKRI